MSLFYFNGLIILAVKQSCDVQDVFYFIICLDDCLDTVLLGCHCHRFSVLACVWQHGVTVNQVMNLREVQLLKMIMKLTALPKNGLYPPITLP